DEFTLSGADPEGIFPAILGHEGAGIVVDVGKGVTSVKKGDHVIPLYTPECRQCPSCLSRKTNLCTAIRATQGQGLMPDGSSRFSIGNDKIFHYMGCSTFSNFTVLPEIALAKVNPDAPFDKICYIGCGVTTGIGAVINTAKVEIGAESYTTQAHYNGKPAAGVAVSLATGANAINTAEAVRTTINRLSSTFPQGVEVVYPYDTSPFVRLSIEEVVKTLAEAIVLVFLVMLLFLQNLRATIIPTIAVPVVLLGTFGVLSFFGYSINTLTMFAMVLAIGLLVDDAIVVVENVERVMHEEGLPPKEATRKSMNEITGALIGIATVLSAVFVPMAFFGGSTGIIYRQFSVTIVSAMVLSVLVALVLTPALCATILRPAKDHATQRGPFGWFNRMFDRGTIAYRDGSHGIINRSWRFLAVFLAIVVAMGWMFARLPSSFLPDEDQGILITSASLPAGATQDRTERVLAQVTDHYLNEEKDAVEGVFTASGFGFGGSGQNVGIAFVRMKDFDQRKTKALSVSAVAGRAMAAFSKIRDAQVFALAPPAIQGFGNTNGFDFYLQD
ncbi:MAG: hypothetical protein E5W01_04550, partial [Mesorhizobium sp.]